MPVALIVEDNAMNRKLLRDILEIQFEVLEAESAEAACELLRETRPDLILMDLRLPEMDGLTFIRQIKETPDVSRIPVVAVSADAMPDSIERALQAGCADYITKPITDDPLVFAERMLQIARSEQAK